MSLPARIGKFEILKRLGKGAMGEVFLARDTVLGREVAVKTILASSAFGEEAKARFEREARSTAALNHPNIVTVYEFGEEDGIHFLAMEYLEGEDLETLIQKRELSPSEAFEVLAQICDGLTYAHERGIIHRDVKPANVLVLRRGKRLTAKLMDFGVALVNQSNLTQQGIWMGTANYMAPEYLDTGKAGVSSDLFAIGVMLYEVVSRGRKPFGGETTMLVLSAILGKPPEPFLPEEIQDVEPRLLGIIQRALAKKPEERFQSAENLASAIRAANTGDAPTALPSSAKKESEKPLIVGKGGRATCLSLRVALRQALPGAHITVLPGIYRESLSVDKDVTIAGEGDPDSIVLESNQGVCLNLRAGQVTIRGLTIRKVVQEESELAQLVEIQSGRAVLEDCELIAPKGTALRAEGPGTQLLLKVCHLQGEPTTGITVAQGASVNLSDCVLEGHGRVGVQAETGAGITLFRTVIKGGEGIGVRVQSQGQASLEDCEISACQAGGLQVDTEGRANLLRCRLESSQFAGVLALEKAQVVLQECQILAHGASGLHAAKGAIVSIRQCHLHHNQGFGLSATDQGLCTVTDSEINDNGHPGVFINRDGTVQIQNSKLHDGQSLGVVCATKGRGALEDCEIYGNAQSGAKVERGGSLLLVRCIFRDGRDSGMLLFENAELTLEECSVHRNARGGILLSKDASDPILRGSNQIDDDLLRANAQGGVVKLAPVKQR